MRKIKKVTLLKDIGLPENFIAKAGTEGVVKVKNAAYWRFYNGDDNYYSYSEYDIKQYSDYFKIEYETPKIKSVAVKLNKLSKDYHGTAEVGYSVDHILSNPEKFIIEYEEDSE